jgi:hypothetical protein
MPVALARKVEFILVDAGLDLDITLQPIVLTPEQCEEYRLPRTPMKETERRAARFEERFGAGATELDALEALHPGELASIVRAEVCRYLDPTLSERVRAARRQLERSLDDIESDVRDAHAFQPIVEKYEDIQAQLEELDETAAGIWESIGERLEEVAPEVAADVPKPREATPHEEPLFDSKRDYLSQIDAYRGWQGRKQGDGKARP